MSGLLLVHIIVATMTVATSFASLIAVWKKTRIAANLSLMWGSFIVTAGTGVLLVVVTPSTLLHTCVLMTLYVGMLSGVQMYANRQVRADVQ